MKSRSSWLLKFAIIALTASFLTPPSGLSAGNSPSDPPKFPIVLLPGMFASFNWTCFSIELDCSRDETWGWMITGEGYYRPLLYRLEEAGYTEENGYLSIFFYDWRKPVQSNVARLKSKIQAVKDGSGAEKVDLIGHSMGGLLARAYVQDSSYSGDVARLVTLGSPHYGVAKVYPFWQAAYVYEANVLEKIGYEIAATLLMVKTLNPVPVLALRKTIPSAQDLLPVWDYLYDDQSDLVKSESRLKHRNTFLYGLNESVDTLFQRLGDGNVAAFAGQGISTGERYYVHKYNWWWNNPLDWYFAFFNWDDGEPDWSRQSEFRTNTGDTTILASSARLPYPAYYAEFLDVEHARLPGDGRVIDEIFRFLDISPVPETGPQPVEQALILYLYGPANATVTDPQGKIVSVASPTQVSPQKETGSYSSPFIPGAEYLTVPGDTFTYILIPGPTEGQYQIEVEGTGSGTYSLGLLDTFGPSEQLITNLMAEWDTAQSQIEPFKKVTFTLDFSEHLNHGVLIAETPVIETPVLADHTVIRGRALPGKSVEIRDAADDSLLGSGQAGAGGDFEISLSQRLELDQRIYPASGGVPGVAVDVQPLKVFLPVMER